MPKQPREVRKGKQHPVRKPRVPDSHIKKTLKAWASPSESLKRVRKAKSKKK